MLLTLYSPVFLPLRSTKQHIPHGPFKTVTKRKRKNQPDTIQKYTYTLFVRLLIRMPHENVVKWNYFIHVMFLSQYAAAVNFIPSLSLIYARFFQLLFISARRASDYLIILLTHLFFSSGLIECGFALFAVTFIHSLQHEYVDSICILRMGRKLTRYEHHLFFSTFRSSSALRIYELVPSVNIHCRFMTLVRWGSLKPQHKRKKITVFVSYFS